MLRGKRQRTALTSTSPVMAISVEDSGQEENEEDAEETNAHDVDAGIYKCVVDQMLLCYVPECGCI